MKTKVVVILATVCFSFVFVARASEAPSEVDRANARTELVRIDREVARLRAQLVRLDNQMARLRAYLKEAREKSPRE